MTKHEPIRDLSDQIGFDDGMDDEIVDELTDAKHGDRIAELEAENACLRKEIRGRRAGQRGWEDAMAKQSARITELEAENERLSEEAGANILNRNALKWTQERAEQAERELAVLRDVKAGLNAALEMAQRARDEARSELITCRGALEEQHRELVWTREKRDEWKAEAELREERRKEDKALSDKLLKAVEEQRDDMKEALRLIDQEVRTKFCWAGLISERGYEMPECALDSFRAMMRKHDEALADVARLRKQLGEAEDQYKHDNENWAHQIDESWRQTNDLKAQLAERDELLREAKSEMTCHTYAGDCPAQDMAGEDCECSACKLCRRIAEALGKGGE